MKLKRRLLDRRQIKSSEGELIWELENSYSLSPKLSSSIMMTAKECLLKEYNLREGQIEVTVIGIEERSGKVIDMMKEKFTFLKLVIFLLLISPISLKSQNIIWERTFDTGQRDNAYGIATDKERNVIVTGFTYGGVNNYEDWLTIKYNLDGDTLWARIFDASSYDRAYCVTTDFIGNVIVTGITSTDSTCYDFCTVKYDPDGNIMWIRTFSNDDDNIEETHSAAVDSKGNIIVTGFTFFISSGYSYDYQTIKYDPDGNVIWVRTYDGGWNDSAEAVAVDDSDNVIVTGYSDSNINWDWLTIKYSPEGDTLWIRCYDVGIDDWAHGVTIDQAGNVIVVGALGHSPNRWGGVS